jgi:hypothetical protein
MFCLCAGSRALACPPPCLPSPASSSSKKGHCQQRGLCGVERTCSAERVGGVVLARNKLHIELCHIHVCAFKKTMLLSALFPSFLPVQGNNNNNNDNQFVQYSTARSSHASLLRCIRTHRYTGKAWLGKRFIFFFVVPLQISKC